MAAITMVGAAVGASLWRLRSTPSAPPAAPGITATPPLLMVGSEAPVFALAGPGGRTVSLTEYQGQPLVLCFFCACEPCIEMARAAAAAVERQQAVLLGMIALPPPQQEEWLKRIGRRITLLHDPATIAKTAYQVHGCPAVFVLDGQRRVLYRTEHPAESASDRREAVARIKAVLSG